MKKSASGYICLHRKIFTNKFYNSEPFCRIMAWIDLLLLANHAPGIFYHRNIMINVNRGQTAYSIESLSIRWQWSRGKVERWLRTLENERQIVRQKTNLTTLITILNYNQYQIHGKANSNPSNNADGQQTDTNNNDKRTTKKGESGFANASAPPLDKPYAVGPPKSPEEIARELLTKKFNP